MHVQIGDKVRLKSNGPFGPRGVVERVMGDALVIRIENTQKLVRVVAPAVVNLSLAAYSDLAKTRMTADYGAIVRLTAKNAACAYERPSFVTRVVRMLEGDGYLRRDESRGQSLFRWVRDRSEFNMSQWIESKIYNERITRSPADDRPRERLLAHRATALRTAELLAIWSVRAVRANPRSRPVKELPRGFRTDSTSYQMRAGAS